MERSQFVQKIADAMCSVKEASHYHSGHSKHENELNAIHKALGDIFLSEVGPVALQLFVRSQSNESEEI